MVTRNAPRPISALRQRMIEDMTIRNLSPTTQASYVFRIIHLVPAQFRHPGEGRDP